MKKEIIVKDNGILRITTLSERWYAKQSIDLKTGLPIYEYFPSSTWICGYYYTSPYLVKWIADKGMDESERLKKEAGDKGSKVHYACEDIDLGKEIPIEAKYQNPSTEQEEELTPDEIECIQSYVLFFEDYRPELFASELTVFGDVYAGTIDKIIGIKDKTGIGRQIYILDLKTSKAVWEEHKLQISSYSHANIDYKSLGITDEEWENRKLAVLQLGYKLNKAGYKFTEIEDKYDLFRNVAYKVWQNENPGAKPKERDFPLILKSDFRISELKPKVNKKSNKK